jgi:hypothetical protein
VGRSIDRDAIFLSASVPAEDRHPRYFKTADVVGIRDAVRGLAGEVLRRHTLVFGGHPAISPLILTVAQRLGAIKRVRIYQSELFRSVVPKESVAFPNIVWTKAFKGDRERSLRGMRDEMIRSATFTAGVFIGGMDGVEHEFDMFAAIHPTASVYPVASTGAAASLIFKRHLASLEVSTRDALAHETTYGAMFRRLLNLRSAKERRRSPRQPKR